MDKCESVKRWEEELILVKEEMTRCVNFYISKLARQEVETQTLEEMLTQQIEGK